MLRPFGGVFFAFLLLACASVSTAGDRLDYNRDVRPILAAKCFSCHGVDASHREAGLRLDLRSEATKALESGAVAVSPKSPEKSELVHRISADGGGRMPPKKAGDKLSKAQIATLTRWIAEGAEYAAHWSFVPPNRPATPAVKNQKRVRNPIDAFLLARLEKEGLDFSPEADRHSLLRRLRFDLTGLPPSVEELNAFVADQRPDAYERLVDRLLADPAYGERWARMWLDLARYADSAGYGSDPLRTIWRYRDWVIDSFNRNEPFDRFTIRQLAGDLLPKPTPDDLLATAFHRNTMTNTEGGTDDEEFRVAAVKDRVDVTMQVWMGLTAGCAKCHSHKFDPLSQKEYYQLFAFFNQSADYDQPSEFPTMPSPTAAETEQSARIDAQIASLRKKFAKPTPELAAEQHKWEAALAPTSAWEVLNGASATAESKAAVEHLPDGSFRVVGVPDGRESYTVTAAPKTSGATVFRLEALPDPASPSGGSGRGGDGNFVLSKVRVFAGPLKEEAAVAGRYVRIELPGKERMLSLAEVQVFQGQSNLALKKPAVQSSTAFDGPAALAVDGNTDGDFHGAKSTTHTNTQNEPWWEVDLGRESPLDRIVVWNRMDGGLGARLQGFRILVLDAKRSVVWRQDGLAAPKKSSSHGVSSWQEIPLVAASADFSQSGFPVGSAISAKPPKNSGWAVSPRQKEPHAAVFVAESPVAATAGRLRFVLEHNFRDRQYALRRFRISVSRDAAAAKRAALPAEVLAALDKPALKRTPQEAAAVGDYFRTQIAGKSITQEIARLEASKPKGATVPIMQELPPNRRRTSHLLEKGNFLAPGEAVAAVAPTAFNPWPTDFPANRLGLAKWLVAKENPLTSRVAVNRYWARIFGKGIVESEEDFGMQGEPPSHPELLDWLATEYIRLGWDTKALLRLIVTSTAYRQSSRTLPVHLEKDPRNRLLARAPRLRLEAEMVRDQALAFSGLLSRRIGGPSVFPEQPPGLWQAAFNGERTWATSRGEDRYRRAMYTFWRRTIPYPSMATFDAPSREVCTIRRISTNTPLQAFVTLNDPVYVECAQSLGRRLMKEGGGSTESRAAFGLRLCLGREPRREQVTALVGLFDRERARLEKDPKAAAKLAEEPLGPTPAGVDVRDLAAWTVVANVLLNLDGVLSKG